MLTPDFCLVDSVLLSDEDKPKVWFCCSVDIDLICLWLRKGSCGQLQLVKPLTQRPQAPSSVCVCRGDGLPPLGRWVCAKVATLLVLLVLVALQTLPP